MKPIYTTIPVGLCEYALKNRKVNHLKLYVYLKHISDGHIPHDPSLYECWATDIECSKRWIYEGLDWLIKNKWITVNSKRKSLRIISYQQLCKRLCIIAEIAAVYEPEEFTYLTNFCAAVVISYNCKRKAWLDKKRRPVSKMGDASTSRNFCSKGYYTLPIRYLSKCLGVSDATANNYKQKAVKAGLIEVKKQVVIQTDVEGNKLSKDKILVYKEVDASNSGRLRIGSKYLKMVEADQIKPYILLKRKRYDFDEKN